MERTGIEKSMKQNPLKQSLLLEIFAFQFVGFLFYMSHHFVGPPFSEHVFHCKPCGLFLVKDSFLRAPVLLAHKIQYVGCGHDTVPLSVGGAIFAKLHICRADAYRVVAGLHEFIGRLHTCMKPDAARMSVPSTTVCKLRLNASDGTVVENKSPLCR